ncbi:MBL fold metallo-hydrolase [Rhodobacteraceae bacterium M382]|nr:MBL fold metallo-hydrolase [Rhodobacteraceae bacterium M382]
MLNLDVYHGVEANVNSYLFTDNNSAVLVDCLRNSEEAAKLAEFVKSTGKHLTRILVTHGHADHYIGLNVLTKAFPSAEVVVSRQEIKDDIIAFSKFMEGVGWLDAEPAMKVKSESAPDGFDYENTINVLPSAELKLSDGAVLDVQSEYNGAECEHLTTIFSKDLNAFFTGDFCYNGVHMWVAIEDAHIENWKTQLEKFQAKYSAGDLKIYPGHGPQTDVSLFGKVHKYLEDFQATVAAASSREEAMDKMKALYPDHKEADFLLLNSVNAKIAA